MTKQTNPNIGHIACPICSEASAVRRNKGGRLYFDCMHCGRITPNHAGGQRFVLDNAMIWGADGPPDTVPAWIREQWPYTRSVRHRSLDSAELQPIDAGQPANDESSVPDSNPVPAAPGQLPPPPPRPAPAADHDTNQPVSPARGFGFLNF